MGGVEVLCVTVAVFGLEVFILRMEVLKMRFASTVTTLGFVKRSE